MKYAIKEFSQVFNPEFINFLTEFVPEEINKNHLSKIMEKVEQFEEKYNLEFVSFFGSDFIIFKHGAEN